MSLHKGNHFKPTKLPGTIGEAPAMDVRGISSEAKAIRAKHRSSFGFCSNRRTQPKP